MVRTIRATNVGNFQEKGNYHSLYLEFKEVFLRPCRWCTSAEDLKLREVPWQISFLKFSQEPAFPPHCFDLMKLSLNRSDERLTFFFEQFVI